MLKSANGIEEDTKPCSSQSVIEEMGDAVRSNVEATQRLCTIVDEKVDKLIDVIAGKGMIPVESLKMIIMFILLFTFALQFGVDGILKILGMAK